MSFHMFVRPSVRTYLCSSNRTNFREILYRGILLETVNKIQIWLKSNKNIRNFFTKTRGPFIFAGDINSPQEKYFVALSIFMWLRQ